MKIDTNKLINDITSEYETTESLVESVITESVDGVQNSEEDVVLETEEEVYVSPLQYVQSAIPAAIAAGLGALALRNKLSRVGS